MTKTAFTGKGGRVYELKAHSFRGLSPWVREGETDRPGNRERRVHALLAFPIPRCITVYFCVWAPTHGMMLHSWWAFSSLVNPLCKLSHRHTKLLGDSKFSEAGSED